MARDIVGIDVHVHLSDEFTQKAKGDRTAQMAKYFGRERPPVSIDEMADQYRARKMMAVIMNTRDETVTGFTPVPNDDVASAVKKHPDVFLAFGAIDPGPASLRSTKSNAAKTSVCRAWASSIRRASIFSPTTFASTRSGSNAPNEHADSFHGGMAAAGPALRAAWGSSSSTASRFTSTKWRRIFPS